MYGHHGRILMADLNTGQIRTEHFFDEGFPRKYQGGNGMAARIIRDTVSATVVQ